MIGNMQARLRGAVERSLSWIGARRFVRQQDGATTVEFALVAAPFLAIIFAIIETAIVFFAGQTLETADADSARLIMTGQAQTQGFSQAQFKNAVCAQDLRPVQLPERALRRREDLHRVRRASTTRKLRSTPTATCRPARFGYQPGGPGDIVVVRLIYQWPVYVSLLGLNLSDSAGSKRLIMSTVAFRNEPYLGLGHES